MGWREDALPSCSAPTCNREIKNGDRYGIPRGSIYLLCQSCYLSPQVREDPRPVFGPPLPARSRVRRRVIRTQEEQRAAWRERARAKARARRAAPDLSKAIPCPVCLEPFVPATYGKPRLTRFCSRKCSSRGRERTSVIQVPSVCPACGQSFWPTNPGVGVTNCCSLSCARYHFWGKTNPNPVPRPWTWTYPRCLDCGRTDRRPKGRGYCSVCYTRRWPNKGRSPGGKHDRPDVRAAITEASDT